MSRSVSSREVRLHDQDELDWTLPCESNVHSAISIDTIPYGSGFRKV